MKEFLNNHPFISLIMLETICGSMVTMIRILKGDKHVSKTVTICVPNKDEPKGETEEPVEEKSETEN